MEREGAEDEDRALHRNQRTGLGTDPVGSDLARMFGLSEFWGGFLDDEAQSVASDVQGRLEADGKPPSEAHVRDYVLRRARQERNRIGRDGLAIVKSFFYEHVAQTPILRAQVVLTCSQGT